jgi:hypothetical protein
VPGQLRPPSTQALATKKEDGNEASPYQKPRIRRGRAWVEILPAGPRDPDVVRAKALAQALWWRACGGCGSPADLSQAGGPPDVFFAGYGLFHLNGDLP